MRVAAYARYSSDQQRDASLEDQLRNCREFAARHGWPAPEPFTDAAISGAREDRPGYRALLARAHEFGVILVDDLTRLSRDSVEVQRTLRRLKFAGVRVIAIADSLDTARDDAKLNAGLRGLMGELYLDDLAKKTHRGLTGRALEGASAGGIAYGYRVTSTGQRAIDEHQAAIVRRIFDEYIAGRSPRKIVEGLNRDGIPAPHGGTWAASAVRADRKRAIGILANPLYVGQQVWNRSHWVKNPETGRRVRRERPESEWIVRELPHLAIVDRETWNAAQRRIAGKATAFAGTVRGRPPRHLLSGLIRCSECGGPFVVVDAHSYGCNHAKERHQAYEPVDDNWYGSPPLCWHDWNPVKRCQLPEYVPQVAAGVPSPLQLSTWKIGALKVIAELEVHGFITAKGVRAHGIDPRRFCAADGYLEPIGDGKWSRGKLPRFEDLHPEAYAEILAKARAARGLMAQ